MTFPLYINTIFWIHFKLIKLWAPPVLFYENTSQGEVSLSAWAYGYLNLAYFIEKVSNSIHWDCHIIGLAAYALQYYTLSDTVSQVAVQHWILYSS